MISQTKEQVVDHLSVITSYHNHFVDKQVAFAKKNEMTDVNKLAVISNLIEDHKLTLISLEKVEKVNWDKNFLNDIIAGHKILDQILINTKEEIESYLNLNEKFSTYEEIYNQLRIDIKLSNYMSILSSKVSTHQAELYSAYNITVLPNENEDFTRNYNERSDYYKNLSLIKYPVLIGLEKIFNSYEKKDSDGLRENISYLTNLFPKSEEKLNEINIIKSGKYLFNLMNDFLRDWKHFNNDNADVFIKTIDLNAPAAPEAPGQNETQKAWDRYKQDYEDYKLEYENYEKHFNEYEQLKIEYNNLQNEYISKFENARKSLFQF